MSGTHCVDDRPFSKAWLGLRLCQLFRKRLLSFRGFKQADRVQARAQSPRRGFKNWHRLLIVCILKKLGIQRTLYEHRVILCFVNESFSQGWKIINLDFTIVWHVRGPSRHQKSAWLVHYKPCENTSHICTGCVSRCYIIANTESGLIPSWASLLVQELRCLPSRIQVLGLVPILGDSW